MKIVIAVQNMTLGGVQRLVVDDANELHRRAHDVWVVFFEPEQAKNSMLPALRIPRDRIVCIPYARMRSIRSFYALYRFLRLSRPDVLITHHWFANTVGRLAGWLARIPSILSFEHSVYDLTKPRRQFRIDRVLQYISSHVVAVSESVKESLVRNSIEEKRIVVVLNGIDLAPYLRVEHTSAERVRFVFVGRLVGDKQVDVLLEAFAHMREEGELLIVGDGPEREKLRALAEQLGISSRVTFHGTSNNLPGIFSHADVLVLPSRREGFGLVAIEARASGVPVILADFPAAQTIAEDGVSGMIVPGESAALARAMDQCVADPAFLDSLRAHARDGIERFSIEKHVDALLKLVGYHV